MNNNKIKRVEPFLSQSSVVILIYLLIDFNLEMYVQIDKNDRVVESLLRLSCFKMSSDSF